MIAVIIIIISFLLDGILTNFLPYMKNDLTLFTPLLTVVSIFIVYPFYRKKTKDYFIHMFILGILYDLFYTNLLFWNGLLFLAIAYVSKVLYQNLEISCIKLIPIICIIVSFYEILNGLIIYLFQLVPITIFDLVYKISHTLLLNVLYIEVIYIILKLLPKKYKKISIN